jgi:hypothetical protein
MKTCFASSYVRPDRWSLTLLWGALSIAALAVALLSAWPPASTADGAAQATTVGDAEQATMAASVFTSGFERGTPVYRLPPLEVTAKRSQVAQDAPAVKRDSHEARAARDRRPRSTPPTAS